MFGRVQDYLNVLNTSVPKELYWILGVLFCVGCILFVVYYGVDKGLRYTSRLLLFEYLLFLYCSTVFCRAPMVEVNYNLVPFWGYMNYQGELRHVYVIIGNVMNVVVFTPIGFFVPLSFQGIRFKDVMLFGLALSLSIEVLQYVLKRGYLEVDDLIHNTIGCFIGYMLFCSLHLLWKRVAHSKKC